MILREEIIEASRIQRLKYEKAELYNQVFAAALTGTTEKIRSYGHPSDRAAICRSLVEAAQLATAAVALRFPETTPAVKR